VTATRRDIAISILQYGVGIAALAYLLSQVDVPTVAARLRATDPAVLVALVLVTVGGVVSRFDTWRAVVAPFARVSVLTAGRVDLAVNFVNQLLPSRLSGRLAAPFILKAETGIDYGDDPQAQCECNGDTQVGMEVCRECRSGECPAGESVQKQENE